MRLIHTADWHLGRRFRGIDRTPEIALALEQILNQAIELEADAILIAGDIFDIPNPPAYAEKIAYQFFVRLQQAGIPAIAIAGNHDSYARIDSLSHLLSLAGVRALGKPRSASEGGSIFLNTKNGKLCAGVMPFASEQRLLDAQSLWQQEHQEWRQTYREVVADLLQDLAGSFQEDTVNVLMAHLSLEGARLAHSEVGYYTQDKYLVSSQFLPASAQYIALGHIHIHQQVSPKVPAYYSGSLIQIDFGEAEQEKGFYLIDVEPGSVANVTFKPLMIQKPLKVIQCHLKDLEETLEANQYHPGYLKVIINMESPTLGLADRVRDICPQALLIEPRYSQLQATQKPVKTFDPERFDPVEEFLSYYENQLEMTPNPEVLEAFKTLYQQFKETSVVN